MRDKQTITFRLPADIRQWIAVQAGLRRKTMTAYAVELITQGIVAESIDNSVARLQSTMAGHEQLAREVLRQTFVMRYIVETHAKGEIRMPERLGSDALRWADRELATLFSGGEKK